MEKEVATHIAKTAFRSASMLASLIPLLNEHCDDKEMSEKLKKVIARIAAEIHMDFNKKIYETFPEIEEEIDKTIKKYGFLLR